MVRRNRALEGLCRRDRAFRDGGVPFAQLSEFLSVNARPARGQGSKMVEHRLARHGALDAHAADRVAETALQMEAALAAGVDKLMTFEYAHFLSPNSMFNSAHAAQALPRVARDAEVSG
jgi:hypothetical protein